MGRNNVSCMRVWRGLWEDRQLKYMYLSLCVVLVPMHTTYATQVSALRQVVADKGEPRAQILDAGGNKERLMCSGKWVKILSWYHGYMR